MGGRRVIEQFFLDGVPVEPGDGAQPAGDGGPGAAAGFQVAGEALDVGAAGLEQEQRDAAGTSWRTAAGPARTPRGSGRCSRPGTQPGRAARDSVNTGSTTATAADVDVVAMGAPPGFGLRPGKAGPAEAPATMLDPNPYAGLDHHARSLQQSRPLTRIAEFACLADGMTAQLIGSYLPVRCLSAAPVSCAYVSCADIGPLPGQRFPASPRAAVKFLRTAASARPTTSRSCGTEPAGDVRIALVPGAVERSKMRCPRT